MGISFDMCATCSWSAVANPILTVDLVTVVYGVPMRVISFCSQLSSLFDAIVSDDCASY